MKVVAFNGSPRPEGNTYALLQVALTELAAQGIETELVQIGQSPLSGCIACDVCRQLKNKRCAVGSDNLNAYLEKVLSADGILLGSPVYFADLNATMKAFIERVGYVCRVNGDLLARKAGAGVVAVRRAGAIHTLDSINHFFLVAHMFVVGSSYWSLGMGRAPGDVAKDEEGIATMKKLGQNMGWLLNKTREG